MAAFMDAPEGAREVLPKLRSKDLPVWSVRAVSWISAAAREDDPRRAVTTRTASVRLDMGPPRYGPVVSTDGWEKDSTGGRPGQRRRAADGVENPFRPVYSSGRESETGGKHVHRVER